MRSRPLALLLALIFLFAASLFAFADLRYGGWNHDWGFFLLTSDLVARGFTPYVDFVFIYTPLMILLNGAFLKIFTNPHLTLFLLPGLWIAACTALTGWLAYRLSGNAARSLFFAGLFPIFCVAEQSCHLTLEHGVVVFSLLSLIAVAKDRGPRNFFWAGFFVASAVLVKQVAVPLVLLIAFDLREGWSLRGRRLGAFAAGGTLAIAAVFAWFAINPVLLVSRFLQPFMEYAQARSVWHLSNLVDFSRSPVAFIFTVLVFALSVKKSWQAYRQQGWRGASFLSWLAILSTMFVLTAPRLVRDYPHYMINVWPAMLLALIYGLAEFSRGRQRLFWGGIVVFTVLGNFHREAPHWRHQYVPLRGDPSLYEKIFVPAVAELEAQSRGHDRILVLGEESLFEFLARKLPQHMDINWALPYDAYPDEGNPTVIYYTGQPKLLERRDYLLSRGYRITYTNEAVPGVEVWILKKP